MPESPHRRAGSYRWLALRILLGSFWLLLLWLVLFANVGSHPNQMTRTSRRVLLSISPEGWGFFTRDPREPIQRVYRVHGEDLTELTIPHSSSRNLFGLRKAPRIAAIELGILLSEIPREAWKSCAEAIEDCLDKWGKIERVENPVPEPVYCGNHVIERRSRVPWAWGRMEDGVTMPGEILRLDVVC